MLSIFPDPQERTAAKLHNARSAVERDFREEETASSAPVSEQTGESVVLQRQEQMQNLLRNFLESQGFDPSEISVRRL